MKPIQTQRQKRTHMIGKYICFESLPATEQEELRNNPEFLGAQQEVIANMCIGSTAIDGRDHIK